MKGTIYLIPGYGESCRLKRYQTLVRTLRNKEYSVICKNPKWNKPLSHQMFPVEKDAIVFGFSLGAVLAYLVAKKYPCQKVIFASVTPIHKYSFETWVKEGFIKEMSRDRAEICARDIKNIKFSLRTLKTPYVVMAGEFEDKKKVMSPDILVPKTDHRMTKVYANAIARMV
jgi:hypothetical protein